MKNITALSLYVINNVKYRRLVIGLSSKALSRILGHGDEYVANIESKRHGQYLPIDYPLIAMTLNWDTHNLLPSAETTYSDGTLLEKIVFSLSRHDDAEKVLIGMKENKYFDSPKSIEEILDHLYLTTTTDIEKRQVIKDVLTNLVKDGLLKLNNGHYSA